MCQECIDYFELHGIDYKKQDYTMAMHGFLAKENNPLICMSCGRHAIDHSDKAECDVCGRLPSDSEKRHEMLNSKVLCSEHYKEAMEERNRVTTIAQSNRMNGNITGIGDIETRPELFNASTTKLVEAKNKMLAEGKSEYEFCKWMESQLAIAKEKLINIRKQEAEEAANITAIQVQFNQLADRLTKEQRDSLALKDINYKPQQVKVTSPKVSGPKTSKIDMVALKEASESCGAPVEVLKTFMNMRKLDIAGAVIAFKEMQAKMTQKNQ
jgi:hypothetical protein